MQGETLAVAASTLIAFALFQPVRRRVQTAVDHRFDRARYDGDRTAAAFAERLREQVDLAGLEADIAGTSWTVRSVRGRSASDPPAGSPGSGMTRTDRRRDPRGCAIAAMNASVDLGRGAWRVHDVHAREPGGGGTAVAHARDDHAHLRRDDGHPRRDRRVRDRRVAAGAAAGWRPDGSDLAGAAARSSRPCHSATCSPAPWPSGIRSTRSRTCSCSWVRRSCRSDTP